jgi:[acyl-carrier-protein] S-malonyltransferase
MEISVVFPGQGTQYVGMGKDFIHENFFNRANECLNYDLQKLMLEGPAEELKLTQNTQPAIVAHSLMLFEKLSQIILRKNLSVTRVLGHSVGEYSALCASGVLSFEEAVRAVHFRGKFMQEASPAGKGSMFAILKQDEETIRKACLEASQDESQVSPANFNEPSQIVISGDKPACERAIALMEKISGARVKAIELQVSAPFHCNLMKPAEELLKPVLDGIHWKPLKYHYVANIDAREYSLDTPPSTIKENLIKQVCGSVLWTQSIQKINDQSIVVECGPGKVLSGLIKKINPQLKVISLDTESGFSELEAL